MDKLHYPGDHREFMPNRVIGPDTGGAWYRPISAHYFNGVTTIYYRSVPPSDLPEELREISATVVALHNIWKGWKVWLGRATDYPASLRGPRWSNSLQASLISQPKRSAASQSGTPNRKSHRELLKRFKKQG